MSESLKILFLAAILSVVTPHPLRAQVLIASSKDAEERVDEESLFRDVDFLCDPICEGRGSGQRGASEAAQYLARRFRQEGILPFGDNYFHCFDASGKAGHNVMGVLRGNSYSGSDKYIIVAAHFDNIGKLEGHIYPGADSNASGVAAMLGLAGMFKFMREGNRNYNQHIIFVGLDSKQLSMAGSEALWNELNSGSLVSPINGKALSRKNVTMFVNLDILGSCESPIHSYRREYLILLGAQQEHMRLYRTTNDNYNIHLDLGTDYYGSKSFTDMFLKRVSDQKIFLQNGLYSVMFTSGITMRTNRETDTAENLDYTALKKRTWLIFHWIERVIQIL